MYRDYKCLVDNGIEVFSVKTDAFTIKSSDLETAKVYLKFGKDIGGWRWSKNDNINFPIDLYKYQYNNEINIDVPAFERVALNDEWDCNAMCDIFEEKEKSHD